MSRYKKVISGELELPEIEGTKYLIYPTIETKMELLEHIKSTQIIEEVDSKDKFGKIVSTTRIRGKHLNITNIAKTCAKIIYEGCFDHDSEGNRTKKKEEEIDTTENQILGLILESDIMSVYLEICISLGIIDGDKAKALKEGQDDAAKKQ